MSTSPERANRQAAGGLDDLRDHLALLRTKRVWTWWLHAGLHEVPTDPEWRSGRVADINRLATELPYADKDIRIKADAYAIETHAWSVTKWAGRDCLRSVFEYPNVPLLEARVTSAAVLDLGNRRELAVFNLLDLYREGHHAYALPATSLASMIQQGVGDIVQRPTE